MAAAPLSIPAETTSRVPADERAMWLRWREHADLHARESLVALLLPYARTVAATYYGRRMHNEIEFGDYLQYARIGLLEALDRFDPDKGAQFRTFAARRMHGAILDGLERFTEKQQQIAVRQRLQKERIDAVKQAAAPQQNGGRSAGGRVAPRDGEALFRYLADVGIGLALCSLLEGTGMIDPGDTSPPSAAQRHYEPVELAQLRLRLVEVVDRLHPQQRTVIRYHYLQEHPFEQIATLMSVTRGRVSQIHRAALLALRAELEAGSSCDVCW